MLLPNTFTTSCILFPFLYHFPVPLMQFNCSSTFIPITPIFEHSILKKSWRGSYSLPVIESATQPTVPILSQEKSQRSFKGIWALIYGALISKFGHADLSPAFHLHAAETSSKDGPWPHHQMTGGFCAYPARLLFALDVPRSSLEPKQTRRRSAEVRRAPIPGKAAFSSPNTSPEPTVSALEWDHPSKSPHL